MSLKLSVCIITYNHEDYIKQCLESVLNQETNFDYEIIVGDDCSTDRTREIVEHYRKRYPSIIKTIFQPERTGGALNYENVHSLAAGEYVAHLDGDDFFGPNKLKLQVQKLDENADINILWHRVNIFKDDGLSVCRPGSEADFLDQKLSRKDLILYGPFGPHSSTMYRRSKLKFRDRRFFGNDWFISVELIDDGYGLMMSEVLGSYRITSNGLSLGATANKKNRQLLCRCQAEVMRLHPQYNSVMALRSLATALLDIANCKFYFVYSLIIFLKCRRFPAFYLLTRLVKFYKSSALPQNFKNS
jgi:glycosyltransferase involved in cell wall biosynthesis